MHVVLTSKDEDALPGMEGAEVLQDVEGSPLNGEDDVLKPARNGSTPEDLSLERATLVSALLT